MGAPASGLVSPTSKGSQQQRRGPGRAWGSSASASKLPEGQTTSLCPWLFSLLCLQLLSLPIKYSPINRMLKQTTNDKKMKPQHPLLYFQPPFYGCGLMYSLSQLSLSKKLPSDHVPASSSPSLHSHLASSLIAPLKLLPPHGC